MSVPSFFLTAAATAGVSIQSIPGTKVLNNPVAPTATTTNKEAPMGTMNLADVKNEVAETTAGPKLRHTTVIAEREGATPVKVRIPRPLGGMYTKALVDALEPNKADEVAADEAFMRITHSQSLRQYNRAQIEKALDKFRLAVPEWIDPVTIAVQVALAEAEAKAAKKAKKKAKKAKAVKVAPVESDSDEVAELRSELFQTKAVLLALAKELGVEVPV